LGNILANGEWYGSCVVNGDHYVVNASGGQLARSSDGGITWQNLGTNPSFAGSRNIASWNNKLISMFESGSKVLIGTFGTIQFTNIAATSSHAIQNNVTYDVTKRMEFYIEQDQITQHNGTNYYVNFNMTNIRLISAEITNHPYTKGTDSMPVFAEKRADETFRYNSILYVSVGADATRNPNGWHRDATGALLTTTEAVKNVTTDACAKLKEKHTDNLRIYVVKYRKQTQYKHKVSNAITDFNYDYIDDCATAADHIYDANDETALNTALSDIAGDIKSWAGYTNAQNVKP
jgi:hypothetical protein